MSEVPLIRRVLRSNNVDYEVCREGLTVLRQLRPRQVIKHRFSFVFCSMLPPKISHCPHLATLYCSYLHPNPRRETHQFALQLRRNGRICLNLEDRHWLYYQPTKTVKNQWWFCLAIWQLPPYSTIMRETCRNNLRWLACWWVSASSWSTRMCFNCSSSVKQPSRNQAPQGIHTHSLLLMSHG
jgi:hypothetical protein